MLSDEEREAIEKIKDLISKSKVIGDIEINKQVVFKDIETILNLIEKQSKEIEELKEERKSYAEEYIHNNPWLYKQLNENYILRVESEQRERKAYIKGTNDAHELCNKKWKDKIKAKIDYIKNRYNIEEDYVQYKTVVIMLQSLLEKE